MGQVIGGAAKPKRCNLNKLSQLGTPAAGEHILVSYDNSMTANGQGNFDRYIIGDGRTAAAALELKYLDDSTRPYIVEEVNKAVADIQPIEITGDVTNAPDEEDLTSEKQGDTDVLKFKDKVYNSALYSGLGRTYLRKNIVDGKNVLTQAMVSTANTIYHIQYDYDLNGQTITIPAGCVLEFEGGRLSFGAIVFDETYIAGSDYLCLYSVTLLGTIKNTELNADCVYANDIGVAINNLFNVVDVVKLSKRKYLQKTTILFNKNNKKLIGLNYDKVIEAGGYQQAATEVSCDVDINSVYITSNRCLIKGIRFVTINTNTHAGLLTSAALFGEIRNCEFTSYAVGIHLQGGFNFLVSDCLVTNSVFGIALTGGGSQINGVVVTNNYIKSVYCAIYINNSNNLSFYHNTFEIVHADYKDRTITYITFNYPKSAAIIEYLSKNSAFRDTYIEGCNCVFNTDNNSRCTLIDNMYYNSHIGETYVKAFTQNFFGYVKNITIKNVYFAKRVNETVSLGTKTNGVIYANENVYIEGCQLSYIIVNNANVNIGANLFETTRFGGIVFMDASNIKAIVSSWGTSYSGTTANRPTITDMPKGFPYFDTDLGKPIWRNGSTWVDATGTAV